MDHIKYKCLRCIEFKISRNEGFCKRKERIWMFGGLLHVIMGANCKCKLDTCALKLVHEPWGCLKIELSKNKPTNKVVKIH